MYATLVAAEGHVPLPLTPHQNRKLLPFTRLKMTDKGVRINNRTYNSEELQEYENRHSGIPGQGKKWQIRYSPYAPRFVWLYDHTEDTWVEAEFIHQRLISDAWTQWTWEQATLNVLEDGGSREEQRRIAREVSALRERARRGPDQQRRPQVPPLFTGPALDLDVPAEDPYAGIPDPDPAAISRAPALPRAAKDILSAGQPTPPPRAVPPDPGLAPHAPPTTGGAEADTPAEAGTEAEIAVDDETQDAVPEPPHPARRDGRPRSLHGSAAQIFGHISSPRPAAEDDRLPPHDDEDGDVP